LPFLLIIRFFVGFWIWRSRGLVASHNIAKSKSRSKKVKSHNLIKMCMCVDDDDVARWLLGPEWVLAITVNDEYDDDGKVDTRPGMGAGYYHLCEALV
jgi:hypothetical protein